MKTSRLALLLLSLVLVAACGTKGPLVLPDKAEKADQPVPAEPDESPAVP